MYIHSEFLISETVRAAASLALAQVQPRFRELEAMADRNQQRVLAAFQRNRVSEAHFQESTGYGYGDAGRETLERVMAELMGAEAALVRHTFVSGTHALTVALFGVLRPGDLMLSITGTPYDTLQPVIGLRGGGHGSLRAFGIQYQEVALDPLGRLDFDAIASSVQRLQPRMVYLQRSRGYTLRPSLLIEELQNVTVLVKSLCDCVVMVDDCYGEFVQECEPPACGVDLIAGSLIKNPGGGLAKNGGYIAGTRELVAQCADRLTTPGLGAEVGATLGQNRRLFQGLFQAPQVVGEALKTAVFAAALLEQQGYEVSPRWEELRGDIIQSLTLGSRDALIGFCRGIQKGAPVDAFVVPQPAAMPGYDSEVIMAAGTFIMGASIELSADAPLREPYAVWLQGGLHFSSSKIGLLFALEELLREK